MQNVVAPNDGMAEGVGPVCPPCTGAGVPNMPLPGAWVDGADVPNAGVPKLPGARAAPDGGAPKAGVWAPRPTVVPNPLDRAEVWVVLKPLKRPGAGAGAPKPGEDPVAGVEDGTPKPPNADLIVAEASCFAKGFVPPATPAPVPKNPPAGAGAPNVPPAEARKLLPVEVGPNGLFAPNPLEDAVVVPEPLKPPGAVAGGRKPDEVDAGAPKMLFDGAGDGAPKPPNPPVFPVAEFPVPRLPWL